MPDDREVIEDFCKRAAVSAVADLIRQHGGELVLHSTPRAEIEGPKPVDADVLDFPRQPVIPTRWATATPVPQPEVPLTWWERVDKLSLALKVAGVLAGLGLVAGAVWAVVMIVQAIVAALVEAVEAVMPVVVGIGGIIVIIFLLSLLGGGGGKGFSGTFQGKMH